LWQGTTSQLAEKGIPRRYYRPGLLLGLKPTDDLIGFIGTTEVVPCHKAFEFAAHFPRGLNRLRKNSF
jgi:hypothetical protein